MNLVNFEAGNQVTKYQGCYKLVNLYLQACYGAIKPERRAIIASTLFRLSFGDKRYAKVTDPNFDPVEENRIYNRSKITNADLLREIDPVKYGNGGISTAKNESDVNKVIRDLDADNIYYRFSCGKPAFCIYVYEREIRCWRYFNSYGCVIPKTLKKIILVSADMIEVMNGFIQAGERNANFDLSRVQDGFGNFINRLIWKMNPSVVAELPQWDDNKHIESYIEDLMAKLSGMGDYDGLEIHPDFEMNIPPSVRGRLERLEKKYKSINAEVIPVKKLKELVPPSSKSNVGKLRRKKTKNVTKFPTMEKINKDEVEVDDGRPALIGFESINPFEDEPSFVRFYIYVVQAQNKTANIKFDTTQAARIIDKLSDCGRRDKSFLKAWIEWYVVNKLRGSKIYKPKYTSLQAFGETLADYNKRFFCP